MILQPSQSESSERKQKTVNERKFVRYGVLSFKTKNGDLASDSFVFEQIPQSYHENSDFFFGADGETLVFNVWTFQNVLLGLPKSITTNIAKKLEDLNREGFFIYTIIQPNAKFINAFSDLSREYKIVMRKNFNTP